MKYVECIEFLQAAVVGSTWGRVRWPGTKRTVEGSAAAWVAMVAGNLCFTSAFHSCLSH